MKEGCIGKYSFPENERIKKSDEISWLKGNGKVIYGKYYLVIYKRNDKPFNRLGIIVSKKNRTSIIRNYEKRIIREIYRTNKEILERKIDLLVIKKKDNETSFQKKLNDLKKLFKHTQY